MRNSSRRNSGGGERKFLAAQMDVAAGTIELKAAGLQEFGLRGRLLAEVDLDVGDKLSAPKKGFTI